MTDAKKNIWRYAEAIARVEKRNVEMETCGGEGGRGQRNGEAKETTRERREKEGGGASALGRELERWIFFMKGFEGRAGRVPRLVLKP